MAGNSSRKRNDGLHRQKQNDSTLVKAGAEKRDVPGEAVIQRGLLSTWVYQYNVTFGLYMLDWWERYLFNTAMVLLLWFIVHNTYLFVYRLASDPNLAFHLPSAVSKNPPP